MSVSGISGMCTAKEESARKGSAEGRLSSLCCSSAVWMDRTEWRGECLQVVLQDTCGSESRGGNKGRRRNKACARGCGRGARCKRPDGRSCWRRSGAAVVVRPWGEQAAGRCRGWTIMIVLLCSDDVDGLYGFLDGLTLAHRAESTERGGKGGHDCGSSRRRAASGEQRRWTSEKGMR